MKAYLLGYIPIGFQHDNKGEIKRLGRFMKIEYWRSLKATLVPFSPRYSPHKLKVPPQIFKMCDEYALSAEKILS